MVEPQPLPCMPHSFDTQPLGFRLFCTCSGGQYVTKVKSLNVFFPNRYRVPRPVSPFLSYYSICLRRRRREVVVVLLVSSIILYNFTSSSLHNSGDLLGTTVGPLIGRIDCPLPSLTVRKFLPGPSPRPPLLLVHFRRAFELGTPNQAWRRGVTSSLAQAMLWLYFLSSGHQATNIMNIHFIHAGLQKNRSFYLSIWLYFQPRKVDRRSRFRATTWRANSSRGQKYDCKCSCTREMSRISR